MKFTTQLEVIGIKSSKGQLDNGQAYDSTKIYCQVDLDQSKGNAKGYGCAEYPIGDSTEFAKFKHLTFPFVADAEIEIVTTGRTQKTQVLTLRPREFSAKKVA
jgi:hypothetical protein